MEINKNLFMTLVKEAKEAGIDINVMLSNCLNDVRDYKEAKEALEESGGEYVTAQELAQELGIV